MTRSKITEYGETRTTTLRKHWSRRWWSPLLALAIIVGSAVVIIEMLGRGG